MTGTLVLEAGETLTGIDAEQAIFSGEQFFFYGVTTGIQLSFADFLENLELHAGFSDVQRTFTGNFLSYTVSADTPVSTYEQNVPDFMHAQHPRLTLTITNEAGNERQIFNDFQLRVQPAVQSAVPGPAAALPFALIALKRRKRA